MLLCGIVLQGLSTCKSLKWLAVHGNKLESLAGIENLSNIMVLNASLNLLTSIREVLGLLDLRALIVNSKLSRHSPFSTFSMSLLSTFGFWCTFIFYAVFKDCQFMKIIACFTLHSR
ncbi:hypothetical protein O6H91_Y578900 [Diphasiastrum complanatum]|nr:hypothetical protein O6H91_Y578900 [Diphasiastrum complanatum]